jgi:hypothetical protein
MGRERTLQQDMLINTHKPQAEGSFCEIHGKTQELVIEDHSWHVAILTEGTEWLFFIQLTVKHRSRQIIIILPV